MIELNIINKERINELLSIAIPKREEEILKKFTHKDVQKEYIKELKQKVKAKAPYNFFILNEINNYSLINKGIEITEKKYYYFLEVLPPKYINNHYFKIGVTEIVNAFCVDEPVVHYETGVGYNAFFQTDDGKFYCAYIIVSNIKNKKKEVI